MVLLRALVLIVCLSATGWFLIREQRAGRFQRVDEHFLDLLVANSRATLTLENPAADANVVLVRLREEDANEYAAWPPPPIDWHTLIKSLQVYNPDAIVIAQPLNWGQPPPEFLPSLADALMPLSGVVMGVEAQPAAAGATVPPFMGGLEKALPRFQRVDGDTAATPRLGALIAAPDDQLRRYGQLGLLSARLDADGTWRLPYAMREGQTLMPSVLAQALAAASQTPFAQHRLRLGPGAGAYLRGGLFVPLLPSGEMAATPTGKAVLMNALDLMSGTLADALTDPDKVRLKNARIVVIGIDHDDATHPPSAARLHANALAQVLALPRIRMLSQTEQWIAWGAAILAAFFIVLRVANRGALLAGLGLVFASFVISYLAFQTYLLWCPPTIPAAFICVGALVGRVFGKAPKVVAEQSAAQS